jgi:DNA invertase Pin-like site-specific DNA recombinase
VGTDNPFNKLTRSLEPGGVVMITKLDRLARSTKDLLNILDRIGRAGGGFKVLDNPALDTTTPHGKLLIDMLAAIAEFERKLIAARTGEGQARAKARGVKFGRKRKLTPFQQQEAIARHKAGERVVNIARSYGVAHPTILRLLPNPLAPSAGVGAA